jgi:dTDP-4-dehydrorhamnose 3,5-epimerase
MEIEATALEGVFIVHPFIHRDNRGAFFESFNALGWDALGFQNTFVQDNVAESSYGVIRGLHLQLPPSPQAKLVGVLEGKILDVAVDVRKASPTYGQHVAVWLDAIEHNMLYIPHGFAHGYAVHSPHAVVQYKCDAFWNPIAEKGIAYNDPTLAIDWGIPEQAIIVSEKDKKHPNFLKHSETSNEA